jgi:hypothetical protein
MIYLSGGFQIINPEVGRNGSSRHPMRRSYFKQLWGWSEHGRPSGQHAHLRLTGHSDYQVCMFQRGLAVHERLMANG